MFLSDPIQRLALRQVKTKDDMAALKKKYAIPDNVAIQTQSDPFASLIEKSYPETREKGIERSFLAQDRVLQE